MTAYALLDFWGWETKNHFCFRKRKNVLTKLTERKKYLSKANKSCASKKIPGNRYRHLSGRFVCSLFHIEATSCRLSNSCCSGTTSFKRSTRFIGRRAAKQMRNKNKTGG